MALKVKDLAKELGVKEQEVIDQLRKLYVDVEDSNSKVDDKVVGLLRIKMGIKPPEKKKPAKKLKKLKDVKEKAKKGEKETKGKVSSKKKEKKKTEEKPEKAKEKAKKEKIEETPKEKPSPIRIVKKSEVLPEKKPKPAVEVVEKFVEKEMPKGKPQKGKKGKPKIEIIEKSAIKVKKGKHGRKGAKGKQVEVRQALDLRKAPARKTRQKLRVSVPISARDLAPKINEKPSSIIQLLMGQGMLVNINQDLEEDVVRLVMDNFGYDLELPDTVESIEKELVSEQEADEKAHSETRAPVVTFMGHVDHGKTSLLDYIRKTMVTKGEKGGITQHIGAYKVETNNGSVTFLDTPGHAAFTAMRARGANATDVVVLVVAADDGVMPQTKEAIDHARAANVPVVVAINKCDLAGANPDRVKQELQQEDLAPEDWGGSTIMVEVSAHTGEGIDKLVEMLMLESEMLELKAKPKIRARGVVIEGKKTSGQGVVATLLVQNGTLKPGDVVLCGSFYGRIKAMMNDKRERVEKAPPSTPVEVLGLQGVPEAGEEFFVVKDEKKAKTLSMLKQSEKRNKNMAGSQRVTLEDFHSQMMEGDVKELKIVLKADVQGSIEALKQSISELDTDEVKLNLIHSAVGDINESDIMLAVVSNAVVFGFHVKVDPRAEEIAKAEKVDIHLYDVIYEAIADVKAGLEGLLEPEEKEVFQGTAKVLQIFSASKIGKVAGCTVTKGAIHRKDRIRIKRGQEIAFEGELAALKRFKDDVKEVREGFECGISVKNFNNIRVNDIIEAYIIEKIARRLEK